jgi:hypothetical protein
VAPPHDVILATVRDFAERSGATRVAVVLDRGPDRLAPTIVAEPGEPIAVEQGGEHLTVPARDLADVAPLPLDLGLPIPPTALDVDPAEGRIEAPIGAVDALARALLDLAAALGGRTVVHVELGTRSGTPLALAGRAGEAVIVTSGDEQFELPS